MGQQDLLTDDNDGTERVRELIRTADSEGDDNRDPVSSADRLTSCIKNRTGAEPLTESVNVIDERQP